MRSDLQPKEDLFERMADQMGAIMDSMMEEMNSRNYFRSSGRDSWDPPLNVYEVADRFIVCVDLAGMQCEQIDVRVEEGTLHIRGVRPKPGVPEVTGAISVLIMEIDSGKFHRKVPIPADVDANGIRATYRNGYVWIVLPRIAD